MSYYMGELIVSQMETLCIVMYAAVVALSLCILLPWLFIEFICLFGKEK